MTGFPTGSPIIQKHPKAKISAPAAISATAAASSASSRTAAVASKLPNRLQKAGKAKLYEKVTSLGKHNGSSNVYWQCDHEICASLPDSQRTGANSTWIKRHAATHVDFVDLGDAAYPPKANAGALESFGFKAISGGRARKKKIFGDDFARLDDDGGLQDAA